MATKTISLMDDAYHLLQRKKQKGESFSQVVRRLTHAEKDVMQLAGAWGHVADKDIGGIKKEIAQLRKRSTQEALR